uniref:Uncharacterized protein n=1 Tax=Micrurus lemniscatus lemniscatus TaxID=129467 RepID=A0A2D4IFH0_MICLE
MGKKNEEGKKRIPPEGNTLLRSLTDCNNKPKYSFFFLSAGIFILNLVCRDILLQGSVLAALKETFPVLYTQKIEGEVNEIIFCQQQDKVKLSPRDLQEKAQILEKALQRPGQEWDSTYILADMLETIKLV